MIGSTMADSHSDVVAITQLVNLYGLAATRTDAGRIGVLGDAPGTPDI